MKTLFMIIWFVSTAIGVSGQSKSNKDHASVPESLGKVQSTVAPERLANSSSEYGALPLTVEDFVKHVSIRGTKKESPKPWSPPADFEKVSYFPNRKIEKEIRPGVKDRNAEEPNQPHDADDKKDRFHWKPALTQSLIFLSLQHGARMFQNKTTGELGGKFLKDWMRSVKNMRGWRDSDSTFTNYFAHPLQGSLTGRVFVNNSDDASKREFGPSKQYWNSRLRAMAWSAVWSTQFELGPISEASIGNVGLRYKNGYCTMAHVDLFVTPVIGTGVLIGEDAIDKYVLKKWIEKNSSNKLKIRILRSLLTPTMSTANLLRGKMPWKRPERPF